MSGGGGSHAPPSLRGGGVQGMPHPPEALNKKALDIIQRVRDKLTGRDFDPKELLDVAKQVDNLILQVSTVRGVLPIRVPQFKKVYLGSEVRSSNMD